MINIFPGSREHRNIVYLCTMVELTSILKIYQLRTKNILIRYCGYCIYCDCYIEDWVNGAETGILPQKQTSAWWCSGAGTLVALLLVLMKMFMMLVEAMSKSAHILVDVYGGNCSFSNGSDYFVIDSNLYEKISYTLKGQNTQTQRDHLLQCTIG